jgi:hypothetical protein
VVEVDQTLAERIAAAAREMQNEATSATTMDRAVIVALDIVTHAQECGISLVRKKSQTVDTPAATSDTVRRIDDLQYELGQGPCLDAIFQQWSGSPLTPTSSSGTSPRTWYERAACRSPASSDGSGAPTCAQGPWRPGSAVPRAAEPPDGDREALT